MSECFKVVLDHARRYTSAQLYLYLYHRDSAQQQSLSRSRSFKVTNLIPVLIKPACDFILVNNTEVHPTSHHFPVIAQYLSSYGM